jgi:hypothetical protein
LTSTKRTRRATSERYREGVPPPDERAAGGPTRGAPGRASPEEGSPIPGPPRDVTAGQGYWRGSPLPIRADDRRRLRHYPSFSHESRPAAAAKTVAPRPTCLGCFHAYFYTDPGIPLPEASTLISTRILGSRYRKLPRLFLHGSWDPVTGSFHAYFLRLFFYASFSTLIREPAARSF